MRKILHYIAIPIWLFLIPVGAAIGWLKENTALGGEWKK
jgi:hypothetical protein